MHPAAGNRIAGGPAAGGAAQKAARFFAQAHRGFAAAGMGARSPGRRRARPTAKLARLFRASIPLLVASWTAAAASLLAQTNSPSVAALAELSQPARKIPFKDVILATTRRRILDFDTNNAGHVELRGKLLQAADLASERARAKGLAAARANEAGNQMEPFVKAALKEVGLRAGTPRTTAGTAQTTGYPDIELEGDPPCYLELKTYNAATVNTTQRTFYYSPSAQPKVTKDALHLLLAYQLQRVTRHGQAVFVPVRWKLLTLQDLAVDLKFEFNQSNRGLYGADAARAVLAEGETEPPAPGGTAK